MQFLNIENIEFTNKNSKIFIIKDIKYYEDMTTKVILSIQNDVKLDEIASRRDIYGEGNEFYAYKIFEQNRIKIIENNFSLENINSLDIPE